MLVFPSWRPSPSIPSAPRKWSGLHYQLKSRTLAALGGSRLFQYPRLPRPASASWSRPARSGTSRSSRRAWGSAFDLAIVDAPSTGHALAMLYLTADLRLRRAAGPVGRRRRRSTCFLRDDASHGRADVCAPRRRCPGTRRFSSSSVSGDELGMTVDRIVVNALHPARFSREEVERLESVDGRPAAREPPCGPPSPSIAAPAEHAQLRRLRRGAGAPWSRCPECSSLNWPAATTWLPGPRSWSAGFRDRRLARAQGGLHLRRLGRSRQDHDLSRDRHPGMAARGKKVAVLTIDPAKRLANSLGLREELGNEERLVKVDVEGELWAMMLDSSAPSTSWWSGHALRRGARATPCSRTAIYQELPERRPARRSTWRWRSSTSSTRRAATTCWCSTRRPPATRSISWTRRKKLAAFIDSRTLQLFTGPGCSA